MVLRTLGLGDLLTAVPALRALARAFPSHRRVLAAPAALAPLAELTGAVDEVAGTAPLAPLDPSLRGADVAVNLHGRGPQSHGVLLSARPRVLLAFRHPEVPATRDLPVWRADEHEVHRWCRLLREGGIPADPGELDLPAPDVPPLPGARGATLIHPGAASPARRWPPERWAAVARSERDAGRRVLLTGGPQEARVCAGVARLAGLPPQASLAGRTDLPTLLATVAAADRLVCGDTGVAHVATAVGTPSVVLFGPTDPALWGPPPDRPRHVALWTGSRGDPHAPESDPGLLEIGVGDVLAALHRLPAGPAVRSG